MHQRIIIIDLNQANVQTAAAAFAGIDAVEVLQGDVRNLPRVGAFVSPANSLGFMDGGIDWAYSRDMFPGVEQRLKQRIKELDNRTSLGRFFLDIGSALCVPADDNAVLISAPTMFLPQDVSTTRNAYNAFYAALSVARKLGPERAPVVICPLMCTGYGRMAPETSAAQMREALDDVLAGRGPAESALSAQRRDLFVSAQIEAARDEQPDTYQNRELRDTVSR